MAEWSTAADLATAGGTLVLAVATFASVRSANRAARAAERSFLAGLRPLLVPTRLQDPEQKVLFSAGGSDQHWVKVGGGHATAEVTDEAIYMTISLRNVGTGIGVLHGWQPHAVAPRGDASRPPPEHFRLQQRDLYISPSDIGFWQGALRDPEAPEFTAARKAIENKDDFMIDLLYGDFEGGQRTITRFRVAPGSSGEWWPNATHHWNLDRDDPR